MRLNLRKNAAGKRRGASAVEFACIAPVLFMCLFGVFEWCRYVMARNVAENAVREAARFCIARTDTFQTLLTNTAIENECRKYLNAMGTQLTNIQVRISKADMFGQYLNRTGGVVATQTAAGRFDETKFGDYVAIELTGDYTPVLPTFLFMQNATSIRAISIMCSEGG